MLNVEPLHPRAWARTRVWCVHATHGDVFVRFGAGGMRNCSERGAGARCGLVAGPRAAIRGVAPGGRSPTHDGSRSAPALRTRRGLRRLHRPLPGVLDLLHLRGGALPDQSCHHRPVSRGVRWCFFDAGFRMRAAALPGLPVLAERCPRDLQRGTLLAALDRNLASELACPQ